MGGPQTPPIAHPPDCPSPDRPSPRSPMKCPFCGHLDDKVIDPRAGGAGEVIRRRRECEACSRRFTTYERVEDVLPTVVKKDGRREPFDRQKLVRGLGTACNKRPVSIER